MEILKKLFNGQALTFEQFTAALGAASDIKLVNLADGGYVSKEKFDAKVDELTTANNTIKDLEKTVKAFDGVNVEQLQTDLDTWKTKYDTDIAKLRMDHAVEAALTAAGARNVKAVKALLADFLTDAKLAEDGTVKGLTEEIKTLSEGEGTAFLFETARGTQQPGFKGMQPGNPGGGTPPAGNDTYETRLAEARKSGNTAEAVAIKREAAENGVFLM